MTRKLRGDIRFDATTPVDFKVFVAATLRQSEFIETEWEQVGSNHDPPTDDDRPESLLIYEVEDDP